MTAGGKESIARVLDSLAADSAAYFGEPHVVLTPFEFEERPFSFLARVQVRRSAGEPPFTHLFVKAFKTASTPEAQELMRRRVAHDFHTTRTLFDALRPHGDLGVVPPVACYPEHLTLVTEQVEGNTLLDYLYARASRFGASPDLPGLGQTMATAGRWIRVFQSTGTCHEELSAAWFKDYVDSRLQRLVKGRGSFDESDRQRILRRVDVLWERIDRKDLPLVPVHADMALGNILVAGSRIVLLDFAMAKQGGRLLDLTRLFLQIDLLSAKPQLRRSTIREAQQALLEGFEPGLTARHPLFRLHLLLHRVNHFATLTLKPQRFPGSLYNIVIRRQHRRWLDAETAAGPE